MSNMNRAAHFLSHLRTGASGTQSASQCAADTKSSFSRSNVSADSSSTPPTVRNLKTLRWNGWGYNDTEFELNEQGLVRLSGSRYLFSGKVLPELRKWMEDNIGADIADQTPPQTSLPVVAPSVRNESFLNAIEGHYGRIAFDDDERVFHGHGHTCQEVYNLRYGTFARVPDTVVWPRSHEDVQVIVRAAHDHNAVIIPFGGGTSVSQALICPEDEKRMIVSLDMHAMNKIKWINHKSMLACIEGGIVGKDLEDQLNRYGFCMGHEPDSAEFSTLGGWVATRASGMKKNQYGNIEDIVVQFKCVTPSGTFEKSCQVPRMSTGPDLHHVIMGSEGTLGVVTEVVIRLRPLPEVREYGSVVFPDFESGVSCMHEVAMKRCAPVSIRLVDNQQFKFGQALKPEDKSWVTHVSDKVKKWYVTKHKGFDVDRMVAATLLFEGNAASVKAQQKQIYAIAAKYGGMKAGAENGIRGYFLTYMIAYLRDFGFNFRFMAESFETSVPWDNVGVLCNNVKDRIRRTAEKEGVQGTPFVSCRVTQTYDTGACVYFYFGFLWTGLKDPLHTFSVIEHEAREEILKLGGSLSHHHGVGKLRKAWMPRTVSDVGIHVLRGIKNTVDPRNVFASGNIIDVSADQSTVADGH
jgi:alkyldihydroxyacetonephosphate synthase